MAETLFDGISLLFQKSAYSNVTSFEPCRSSIDHYKFYQFSLIPAVILTLLMAATTTRKHKLLKIVRGRPGLLFPMDTLTRSSRLSYACAFGATAFVVYQISIEHTFAFDYKGPQAAITLMAIFSMIIYGIVFFPVFACLALGSAFSFGLGAVYVWMFFIVNLYRLSECTFTLTGRAVLFVRMLPTLFCLCYLSIMLPIRFVRAIRNKDYFRSPILKKRRSETLDDIKNSYQGRHVRKLLTKPVVQAPPDGFANKAKVFFMSQVHKLVYRREEGFRYSSRLLAVMFVAACVVYVITVELAAYFYKLFGNIHQMVVQDLDIIGWEEKPGDGSIINADRRALRFGYYATRTIRFSLMVALVLACTLSFFTILHMMSSFRNNLYAMYRGDFSVIPPPEDMGPVSLCTGSIKFAGYQVAYFVWAYIVTFGILGLVCIAIGFIVHLFLLELTDFIVHILEQAGPSLGIAVFMMIAQWLLARFIFLQDKGQHLRLDNRILKAIGVGMLFLGRLDNSTLPRKFEFFDPGFAAYQGFIHMEAAHTHPVVNVFIRLLASESRKRKRDNLELKEMRTDLKNGSPVTRITKVGHQRSKPINVGARFNWLVTYTLLHNPTVRIYRRGYVQAMKKARLAGIKIPISDKPITTFDLVKTDEEREQEKQEELLKIESLKTASSFRNSTRYDTGIKARQERWANRRDRVQRQETVNTDQESITDDEGSTGSDETPKQRPLATKDIQLKLERLEHIV